MGYSPAAIKGKQYSDDVTKLTGLVRISHLGCSLSNFSTVPQRDGSTDLSTPIDKACYSWKVLIICGDTQ